MLVTTGVPIAIVALAVLGPLAREYSVLRRADGLGRLGALLVCSSLLPALAVGLAASAPLRETPALGWTMAVAITIALYSAGVAVVRPASAASAATQRSS